MAGSLLASALAAVTIAGTGAATASAAPAPARPDATPVSSAAKASPGVRAAAKDGSTDTAIRAYWTAARMKSAIPADRHVSKAEVAKITAKGKVASGAPAGKIAGAKATAGTPALAPSSLAPSAITPLATSYASDWYGSYWSPPATTTGKVFFTSSDGYGYVCSGSAVNSEAKNTVFTAGHCVSDGAGHFHTNWVFVPDYWYNYRPFGTWTAREQWTLSNWHYGGDFRYDVGAVVVNTNAYGSRLVNVVGGQGITWNQPVGLYTYAFGYPAASPFNGESLKYCDGYTYSDIWSAWANVGLDCNMTGGASGGPWLAYFGGTFGYVNGVNSYKYNWLPNNIYSPYFGNAAGSLYNTVRYRY